MAQRRPSKRRSDSRCRPGFKATLFAGEPDVVQPIAFTFDDRGRLWVVENYSYPGWTGEKKDRVLIFEDRDGDGQFDERKVFLDNGSNLSGIEWGFGGVWLCSTPNLVFVPDRNADDVPDGDPVIKLDGWDLTCAAQCQQFAGMGTGRLAVRLQRHPLELKRRQARRIARGAHADQLRRVALSSHARSLRSRRPRHDQPLGARLRRDTARRSSPTA